MHRGVVDNRTYAVRFRPALDAIRQVLEDPDIFDSITRYPERRYIRKPGTQQNMRVWSEAWSGDDWWDIQVCLQFLVPTAYLTRHRTSLGLIISQSTPSYIQMRQR